MLCLGLGQGRPRPASQLQGQGWGAGSAPTGWSRAAWPEPVGTGAGSTQGRHSCSKTSWPSCPHCPSLALTGFWLDPSQPLGLTLSLSSAQGPSSTWETLVPQMAGTKDASWAPGMEKPVALLPRTQPATKRGPQGLQAPPSTGGIARGLSDSGTRSGDQDLRPLLPADPCLPRVTSALPRSSLSQPRAQQGPSECPGPDRPDERQERPLALSGSRERAAGRARSRASSGHSAP